MLHPLRDKNGGTYKGGVGQDDTYDYGLCKTLLREKPHTS